MKNILSKSHFGIKAFTLAEVLITLGIIGVVAAMTIPTLISNYQKAQYASALKKVYATTNQVLQQIAADNGCPGDLKCTGLFDTGTTNDSFGKIFVKYFKTAKDCGVASSNCWASAVNYNFDGSSVNNNNYNTWGRYSFITIDGMSFLVVNSANNCDTPTSSNHATNNLTQICGDVSIDLNGPKPPNYWGRDVFAFFISNGKGALLYPLGGADDNSMGNMWWNKDNWKRCSATTDAWGWYCSGRIMEEGWQINYY